MLSDMRQIKVGVVAPDQLLLTECARNLSSWALPLPVSCPVIGLLPQIFSILAHYVCLNYTLVPLNGTVYGVPVGLNNSTGESIFNGHLGLLQRGEVDIIASQFKWTKSRAAHFDFLRPITRDAVVMLINVEQNITLYDDALALVDQLNYKLWIVFILMFVFLRRLEKFTETKSSTASKLITFCQILLVLHFVNIYKGTLLSGYLLGPAEHPVNIIEQSINQVENGDMKLIVPSSGSTELQMLETSTEPQFQRLHQALQNNRPLGYYEDRSATVNLLNQNRAIYLASSELTFYEPLTQNCNLRVMHLGFSTPYDTYMSMIVRKEIANLTVVLNNAMDELSMPVLIPIMMEKYYREFEYKQQVCAATGQQERKNRSGVTLSNLIGPILMMGGVCLLACGVVIVEMFANREKSK